MSLGGVRDEAEIRGHRRTYVGAMPGRVIKALRDAEQQESGAGARRDRQGRLGRIPGRSVIGAARSARSRSRTRPSRITTWRCRSISRKVIFITTANLLEPIPPALRDRMEIIEVSGYTEAEKLAIARQYLLPKALESHGLTRGATRHH